MVPRARQAGTTQGRYWEQHGQDRGGLFIGQGAEGRAKPREISDSSRKMDTRPPTAEVPSAPQDEERSLRESNELLNHQRFLMEEGCWLPPDQNVTNGPKENEIHNKPLSEQVPSLPAPPSLLQPPLSTSSRSHARLPVGRQGAGTGAQCQEEPLLEFTQHPEQLCCRTPPGQS